MEVKPGYKQTEVGVIPEEWRVTPITSVLQKGTRITYGVVKPGRNDDNGVLFIRGGDIFEGTIFTSQLRTISQAISAQYKRTRLNGGEIVISLVGYPGEVALVPSWLAGANIARQVALLRLDPAQPISGDFICRFLQSDVGRRLLLKESIGSAQQVINLRDINRVVLLLPTTDEQRVIAETLSDVDGLLGGLDGLIAKTRDLKQAAMQQLLTGQTRLPGFHGEWELKRLGEGVALHSGHHVLAQHCNTQSEGVPYLTGPADFPEGRIRHTKFTTLPSTICSPDDILVTVKGSGSGTIVLADAAYCISRQLMAIRVRDWDVLFIYYSLLQNAAQFRAASTGLIPGLSRSDILDQPLPLPPDIPEQIAIAEVLMDMDAELAALEQRREKTRGLKQAMMQELLTGRTRLI